MTELTKEIIKWVLGVVGSILLISIKTSVDNNTSESNELKKKVDKVYEYTTNHEVRMSIIEKQLDDYQDRILNLQLAQERWGDLSENRARHQISAQN